MSLVAFREVPRRQGKELDMRALGRTISWRREMARLHAEIASKVRPSDTRRGGCPICRAVSHHPFVAILGFEYCECDACGHIFVKNPPDPHAVEKLYHGNNGEKTFQASVYVSHQRFRERLASIAAPKADYCGRYVPRAGTWLDVGCATGEFLWALRERGWSVRGVDADACEVEFARAKGLDVELRFLEDLSADDLRNVKAISLFNVLEHVWDPVRFFRSLTCRLDVGGYAVIEVPRHPSLSSFSVLAFPELAARHLYPPDHLHVYSEVSAEHLLREAGFSAVAVWVFGQDFQELIYSAAARAGLSENTFFEQVAGLAAPLQKAIDAENFSDVLLVIARKTRTPPADGPVSAQLVGSSEPADHDLPAGSVE